MRIAILSSDSRHPVWASLVQWADAKRRAGHEVELVQRASDLGAAHFLFLISCTEVIPSSIRSRFRHTLVVHASRLPHGRGWSPHIWQVLEGADEIPVTLLEAEDRVDTGAIWAQASFRLEGHELADEINAKLFAATCELMDEAVDNEHRITPRPQEDAAATYYRRRRPDDSRLDPNGRIAEQFNLLRVADPERYPSFFDYAGHRYKVVVTKMDG